MASVTKPVVFSGGGEGRNSALAAGEWGFLSFQRRIPVLIARVLTEIGSPTTMGIIVSPIKMTSANSCFWLKKDFIALTSQNLVDTNKLKLRGYPNARATFAGNWGLEVLASSGTDPMSHGELRISGNWGLGREEGWGWGEAFWVPQRF
jgi:hypothetical protein